MYTHSSKEVLLVVRKVQILVAEDYPSFSPDFIPLRRRIMVSFRGHDIYFVRHAVIKSLRNL